MATRPFPLDKKTVKQLEKLGRMLLKFYQATNMIYRWSAEGRLPAWLAEWLELSKLQSIIDLQRHKAFRPDLPRVIRPDILLTEDGLKITELDSVPGGIGLTAWPTVPTPRPGPKCLAARPACSTGSPASSAMQNKFG